MCVTRVPERAPIVIPDPICESVPVYDDFGTYAGNIDVCYDPTEDRGQTEIAGMLGDYDAIYDDFGNIIEFVIHDSSNSSDEFQPLVKDCIERPVFDEFGNFVGVEEVCTIVQDDTTLIG